MSKKDKKNKGEGLEEFQENLKKLTNQFILVEINKLESTIIFELKKTTNLIEKEGEILNKVKKSNINHFEFIKKQNLSEVEKEFELIKAELEAEKDYVLEINKNIYGYKGKIKLFKSILKKLKILKKS